MERKRAIVVCVRASDVNEGNEHLILEDSGLGICVACKAMVVIGPSSIRDYDIMPLCRDCYKTVKDRDFITKIPKGEPDQAEVAEMMHRHEARN